MRPHTHTHTHTRTGVCVPFIINQTPAAGGDHVTAPSGLRSRVCGQSLRPSLAPNHFLTGDRGTQLLRAIRLREVHSSRGGGPRSEATQFMSEVDRFLTGKSPKCLRLWPLVSHLRLCSDGAPQTTHDIWENWAAGAFHAGDSFSPGL